MIGWPYSEAPRKILDTKDKLDTLLRIEIGKLRRSIDDAIFNEVMYGRGSEFRKEMYKAPLDISTCCVGDDNG